MIQSTKVLQKTSVGNFILLTLKLRQGRRHYIGNRKILVFLIPVSFVMALLNIE